MKKPLDEWRAEELGKIFPVTIEEYDERWPRLYEEEAEQLGAALGSDAVRVNHIGSTAVPGLAAKPTIDILLEIGDDADIVRVIRALEREGYLYSVQPDKPAPHMMFLKGYTPDGFNGQAYHVHVRYMGDWDEPRFRDYLCKHPEEARRYEALKRELQQKYEHDRDAYTDAKGGLIQEMMQKARAEKCANCSGGGCCGKR